MKLAEFVIRYVFIASEEFFQEGLTAHNALRSIHGSRKLEKDEDLIRKAKDWVSKASDETSSLEKKEFVDFGENIEEQCFDTDEELRAEDAVLEW